MRDKGTRQAPGSSRLFDREAWSRKTLSSVSFFCGSSDSIEHRMEVKARGRLAAPSKGTASAKETGVERTGHWQSTSASRSTYDLSQKAAQREKECQQACSWS